VPTHGPEMFNIAHDSVARTQTEESQRDAEEGNNCGQQEINQQEIDQTYMLGEVVALVLVAMVLIFALRAMRGTWPEKPDGETNLPQYVDALLCEVFDVIGRGSGVTKVFEIAYSNPALLHVSPKILIFSLLRCKPSNPFGLGVPGEAK
jgi:hypothetical protein